MQTELLQKYDIDPARLGHPIDKVPNELKLKAPVFVKENTNAAMAQLHLPEMKAEDCQVPGLPGWLFIKGSHEHPTLVHVDLNAPHPLTELMKPEDLKLGDAVLVLFTVQLWCIPGEKAGMSGTLREIVKMNPVKPAEMVFEMPLTTSPPKRFKSN